PVTEHIWERLPATVELGFVAMFLSVLIGVPLGMYSAVHRGSLLDGAARVFAVLGQSMPAFWLGLMLILIFAVMLGLFPAGGRAGAERALPGRQHVRRRPVRLSQSEDPPCPRVGASSRGSPGRSWRCSCSRRCSRRSWTRRARPTATSRRS